MKVKDMTVGECPAGGRGAVAGAAAAVHQRLVPRAGACARARARRAADSHAAAPEDGELCLVRSAC